MDVNENIADKKPKPLDEMTIIIPKGEFIAAGTTSYVERLPSGDVIKTPLAGDVREEDCRQEIAVEAKIYERLGRHPRLVDFRGWDDEAHTLTLEYMSNGTLEEYVKSKHEQISLPERLRWIAQAAEALHILHSAGVIHCDIGPHNFLLDSDMSLKIADFSGSSLDGSRAMVCPGTRYSLPDPNWKPGKPATIEEDLFSLGSTIYYIATSSVPFDELLDEEVEEKYLAGEFPNLDGVLCAGVIRLCWQQEARSAETIHELVVQLLDC